MIHHQCIQPAPPAQRQRNRLSRNTLVRHVARQHLDARGAVLAVQCFERSVCACNEDKLVRGREEVVCGC